MSSFRYMGPSNGTPFVIAVTNASVQVDLTANAYAGLLRAIGDGRSLLVLSHGDVYYRWSPNTSGDTVDETMAASGGTPANQCAAILTGKERPESPPTNTKSIIVKAPAGNTTIRIWAC